MRTLGLLENTVVMVTSDHGHSIGDHNYVGKRGYPSRPEVLDIPLFVHHPEGIGAGMRSDLWLQHHDISAQILEFAGLEPAQPLDGRPFLRVAVDGGPPLRDHVTVGWGFAVTVIDDRWWLNCKMNGRGVFLHDLTAEQPFDHNVADDHPDIVRRMFAQAVNEAGGSFPEELLQFAADHADAPGCSDLAAFD
jgi:arylsulfatase A-like enzyme